MNAPFDITIHHAQQAAIHLTGALVDLDFYRNHMRQADIRERIAVSRRYIKEATANLDKFEATITEPANAE